MGKNKSENSDQEFGREHDFFESNLDDIRRKYGNETYVAIYQKKIVGSDEDKNRLSERISKKYSNKYVLITSPRDVDTTSLDYIASIVEDMLNQGWIRKI